MIRPGRALIALSLAVAVAVPSSVALAEADIDQTAWWSRTNTSPAPSVTLPVPVTIPAPTVPAGAIAVGATAGQIDKVAAVGIRPDIDEGDVTGATLVLAEAPGATAQLNQTAADSLVVACPILDFWVGGANSTWETLPKFDCATKAMGTRDANGRWTWDLTEIAQLWLDPDNGVAPNGVLLAPEVPIPSAATFQVAYAADPASIAVTLDAVPGEAPSTTTTTTTPTTGSGSGTSGGGSGTSGGGGSTSGGRPASGGGTGATSPTTPAGSGTTGGTAASGTVADDGESPILGNLPFGIWLLVLVVAAIALLLMMALGPDGEPGKARTREGGVRRALAARRRAALVPSTTTIAEVA